MSKSHVTKREAQAVCDFAAEVCTALRMESWVINVQTEPSDEDCLAEIKIVDGKYVAQVWLARDWMKRTDKERRETIVHEVCHLLHHRVNHVFDDSRDLLRKGEHKALRRRYWRETELMVDHLARFITDTRTIAEAWDQAHQ